MLFMATFYLNTRNGLASKNAGRTHSAYIAGVGRYADKTEVKAVIDKNLPSWAIDGEDFFQKADANERANGRSYRSLIFAIPNEAQDKTKWAEDLTLNLLGDRHAYRLAIHDEGHNPHCHLMFTERGRKDDLEPEKYFGRSNPKDRSISQKAWLEKAKEMYLTQIKTVAPSYKPAFSHEPKIGPKMKQAGTTYEKNRKKRIEEVEYLRIAKRASQVLEKHIQIAEIAEQEKATEVESKSTFQIPIKRESPFPKLQSPSQTGHGLETGLNYDTFVPARGVVSKVTDSKSRLRKNKN